MGMSPPRSFAGAVRKATQRPCDALSPAAKKYVVLGARPVMWTAWIHLSTSIPIAWLVPVTKRVPLEGPPMRVRTST